MRLGFGLEGLASAGWSAASEPLRTVFAEGDRFGVAFGLARRGGRRRCRVGSGAVRFWTASPRHSPSGHQTCDRRYWRARFGSDVAGLEAFRGGELANLAPAASALLTGHPRRTFRVPPACLPHVTSLALASTSVQCVRCVW